MSQLIIRRGLEEPDTSGNFVPHKPARPEKAEGQRPFKIVSEYQPAGAQPTAPAASINPPLTSPHFPPNPLIRPAIPVAPNRRCALPPGRAWAILARLPVETVGIRRRCVGAASFLLFRHLARARRFWLRRSERTRAMMYSGTIAAYDTQLGAGFILADKGGERLPFARAELRQAGYVPQERDAYTFEARQDAAGDRHATNLRKA